MRRNVIGRKDVLVSFLPDYDLPCFDELVKALQAFLVVVSLRFVLLCARKLIRYSPRLALSHVGLDHGYDQVVFKVSILVCMLTTSNIAKKNKSRIVYGQVKNLDFRYHVQEHHVASSHSQGHGRTSQGYRAYEEHTKVGWNVCHQSGDIQTNNDQNSDYQSWINFQLLVQQATWKLLHSG